MVVAQAEDRIRAQDVAAREADRRAVQLGEDDVHPLAREGVADILGEHRLHAVGGVRGAELVDQLGEERDHGGVVTRTGGPVGRLRKRLRRGVHRAEHNERRVRRKG
jgi:hypothetical protein